MLAFVPFLLAPRRSRPRSVCPRSMCVHAKAKTRKPADKQQKEYVEVIAKGCNTNKRDRYDKHSMSDASKHTGKGVNKQDSKQKMMSARDKRWFGSNVHNFIVLKYGRHTCKQDSCMDM